MSVYDVHSIYKQNTKIQTNEIYVMLFEGSFKIIIVTTSEDTATGSHGSMVCVYHTPSYVICNKIFD